MGELNCEHIGFDAARVLPKGGAKRGRRISCRQMNGHAAEAGVRAFWLLLEAPDRSQRRSLRYAG